LERDKPTVEILNKTTANYVERSCSIRGPKKGFRRAGETETKDFIGFPLVLVFASGPNTVLVKRTFLACVRRS
jgi:hypothetical protein